MALHIPQYAEAQVIRRDWQKITQRVKRNAPNRLLGKLSNAIGLPGIWGYDQVEVDAYIDVPAPAVTPYKAEDSCRLMVAPGAAILRALNILWALYPDGSYPPLLLDQFKTAFGKAVEKQCGVLHHCVII